MSERELDSSINNYIETETPKNYVKQLQWDMAIGLQEVDNLKPSKYLEKLLQEKYSLDIYQKQAAIEEEKAKIEDKIRELALGLKRATIEILPELKDKLVPNCQAMLWCPEGKASCGTYPTKNQLKKMIAEVKANE